MHRYDKICYDLRLCNHGECNKCIHNSTKRPTCANNLRESAAKAIEDLQIELSCMRAAANGYKTDNKKLELENAGLKDTKERLTTSNLRLSDCVNEMAQTLVYYHDVIEQMHEEYVEFMDEVRETAQDTPAAECIRCTEQERMECRLTREECAGHDS